MSLEGWLTGAYGAEKFRPGLERVRAFLAPELAAFRALAPRVVTVAGTNGKGETALTLHAWTSAAGRAPVAWTSPHLHSLTERFRGPAGVIAESELRTLLEEADADRRRAGVGLSYYEILWVAFLRWGLRQRAPLWILEVGMGGRFDAVNLLDSELVALPSIARDHQEYLGPTYRAILQEKLGVWRPGAQLVSTLESTYLRDRVRESAVGPWEDLFETGVVKREDDFSARNQALAGRLWELLGGSGRPARPDLPGRGETWGWGSSQFVFYGSHNPDGLRKLVQFLGGGSYNRPEEKFHQIWAAFSRRPSPDLRVMARLLAETAARTDGALKLTQFDHPKAIALGEWWEGEEGSSTTIIHEWTDLLRDIHPPPQRILVTGSYYFVALVQQALARLGATSNRDAVDAGASASKCQR